MEQESESHYALIEESLCLVAEKDVDLMPSVYRHLFSISPAAEEVFDGLPVSQRGIMLNKVVEMIMGCAQGNEKLGEFRQYDIPLHDDLGVTKAMYQDYFEAVILALKEALGPEWLDRHEQSWKLEFKKLINEVMAHSDNQ